ncbi:MAG: SpoIIE family protein phosphatase, partial [Proteobacteria bacterium]|nr:SpoIIE family protein phosphatase [Pseudomonadota bacterium]
MKTSAKSISSKPDLQNSAGTLEQLNLLADLSQNFVNSQSIDETLKLAVRQIKSYMGAEAASIFLLDKNNEELICRASSGPVDVTDLTVSIDCSIVGRALKSGECQMIKDARKDSDFVCYVDSLTGFETKSVLCAPLITGGNTIGVIQILNKLDNELFDLRDRDIIRVLATPIALAVQNARLTLDFVEQKRIRKEIRLARRLQRSLLPKREKPPFPVVGSNVAAYEVSGDFYDYFELDDGRVGFIIGDVSGKGLDASMLMVRASSLLRWIGKDKLSPSQWLKKANIELCEKSSRGLFVCAAVGYYYPSTDRVTWSNAGLPPVIFKCPENNVKTWIANAAPLAISMDIEFSEQSIKLNEGGLYLLTDGLTD